LQQLTVRGRAGPRQAAGADAHRGGEVVDRRELDERAVHAKLAEDDLAAGGAAAEGGESPPSLPVRLPERRRVERRPEAIDAETALALRQGCEGAGKRLLTRDEAAPEHADERGEREDRAADDERGAQRLRPQPRARHRQRGARAGGGVHAELRRRER